MSEELGGALLGALGRYVFGDAAHRIVTGLEDLSHEFDDIGDELRRCNSSSSAAPEGSTSISLGDWPNWKR